MENDCKWWLVRSDALSKFQGKVPQPMNQQIRFMETPATSTDLQQWLRENAVPAPPRQLTDLPHEILSKICGTAMQHSPTFIATLAYTRNDVLHDISRSKVYLINIDPTQCRSMQRQPSQLEHFLRLMYFNRQPDRAGGKPLRISLRIFPLDTNLWACEHIHTLYALTGVAAAFARAHDRAIETNYWYDEIIFESGYSQFEGNPDRAPVFARTMERMMATMERLGRALGKYWAEKGRAYLPFTYIERMVCEWLRHQRNDDPTIRAYFESNKKVLREIVNITPHYEEIKYRDMWAHGLLIETGGHGLAGLEWCDKCNEDGIDIGNDMSESDCSSDDGSEVVMGGYPKDREAATRFNLLQDRSIPRLDTDNTRQENDTSIDLLRESCDDIGKLNVVIVQDVKREVKAGDQVVEYERTRDHILAGLGKRKGDIVA